MKNSRMPEIMLKCGPSGQKRLGRPSKRLGEAETGTLRQLVTDVDGVSMNLMCRKDFVIAGSQRAIQYSRIVILCFSFLSTGWAVRGSNPGWGEIFRTRPDRPRVPPSLLYNGYRVFPGGKAAEAWR